MYHCVKVIKLICKSSYSVTVNVSTSEGLNINTGFINQTVQNGGNI